MLIHLLPFLVIFYFIYKKLDASINVHCRSAVPTSGWDGKVIWIIGASQGIGYQLAKHFGNAAGAKLILSSRNEARLQEVKSKLPCPASNVAVLPVDICGPFKKLELVAQAAEKAFGGIDYVVHCVGASMNALVAEVSPEVTDSLLAVNMVGPIKMTRAMLPTLLSDQSRRRAFCGGSFNGCQGAKPWAISLLACKMGLYGYFASLAAELADTNVKVTIVCPGPVGSTHGAGAARAVYGATGLISTQSAEKSDKARMAPERCVELIAKAAYHGVDEAWLSKQPVLTLAYIFQLYPALGWMLLKRIGPKRARAMKEGRSGYDVRKL